MKAIITVGLGFGDEGKGTIVDYLVSKYDSSLVVRYSGGAQAAHNVVTPDGIHHTFSQVGSGYLANQDQSTLLTHNVIIDPYGLYNECEALQEKCGKNPLFSGQIYASEYCLVTTLYHKAFNRILESSRGDKRHGSCGIGIGETRQYNLQYGQDSIFVKDLSSPAIMRYKLELLRHRMIERLQTIDTTNVPDELIQTITSEDRQYQYIDNYALIGQHIKIENFTTLSSLFGVNEVVVFEGSQGTLLDENHGFNPYTTWSTVTADPGIQIAKNLGITDIHVMGITRAYMSRHGAGPFPTYNEDVSKSGKITDHNIRNDWQENIRFGEMDIALLKYAIKCNSRIDSLAITCLDHLKYFDSVSTYDHAYLSRTKPFRITGKRMAMVINNNYRVTRILTNGERSPSLPRYNDQEEFLNFFNDIKPISILSNGPTRSDKTMQYEILN